MLRVCVLASVLALAARLALFHPFALADDGPHAGVDTTDQQGRPVTGACYEVRVADPQEVPELADQPVPADVGTVLATACDADDGEENGTTILRGLPQGRLLLLIQSDVPAGCSGADPQYFAQADAMIQPMTNRCLALPKTGTGSMMKGTSPAGSWLEGVMLAAVGLTAAVVRGYAQFQAQRSRP